MPGCQLSLVQRRGRSQISLSGTFDGASAWELNQRLQSERGELIVDFSQVSSFNDYALAVLSNSLHELRDRGLVLQGLRHHQLRMLRYLGVDVTDAGVVQPAAELTLRPFGALPQVA